MKKFMLAFCLCGLCFAADHTKPIPAKERQERSRIISDIRRNVDKLTSQEVSTLKAIADKYKAPARASAKAAPTPAKKK